MKLYTSSGSRGWLESIIADFLNAPACNRMSESDPERSWGDAAIGYSSGDDPIYDSFKEHVGPFHWTPAEAFEKAFPGSGIHPGELTVISWILPQTAKTRADNRKETAFPCERWVRTRIFGEEVNNRLREHVISALESAGYPAVAPVLVKGWSWQTSEKYGFSSTWSERHAAYAGGLGTFGLCDGLITPRGKAMRTGSVIARVKIDPSPRPYSHHREYCLFFSRGSCLKCMERCPAGAITKEGHDKRKCFDYLFSTVMPRVKAGYGFDGYGCGLCQTGVPCESGIPGQR